MRNSLKRLIGKIDLRDVLVFGGMTLACYGIAQLSVPAAWIIGGGLLMYVGLRD